MGFPEPMNPSIIEYPQFVVAMDVELQRGHLTVTSFCTGVETFLGKNDCWGVMCKEVPPFGLLCFIKLLRLLCRCGRSCFN